MSKSMVARLVGGALAVAAAFGFAASAVAQEKKIKIGVIYDLTGPLAGGGSELQYIGAKIMLDQYVKSGIEGYKVEVVYADAQSKTEVAINEATRLMDQEKVHLLMGVFSSAHCVPMAQKADAIIRGLRVLSDFEFEFNMALMNRHLEPRMETLFVMPNEEFSYTSSTLVKQVARFGGDVARFVPPNVAEALRRAYGVGRSPGPRVS